MPVRAAKRVAVPRVDDNAAIREHALTKAAAPSLQWLGQEAAFAAQNQTSCTKLVSVSEGTTAGLEISKIDQSLTLQTQEPDSKTKSFWSIRVTACSWQWFFQRYTNDLLTCLLLQAAVSQICRFHWVTVVSRIALSHWVNSMGISWPQSSSVSTP